MGCSQRDIVGAAWRGPLTLRRTIMAFADPSGETQPDIGYATVVDSMRAREAGIQRSPTFVLYGQRALTLEQLDSLPKYGGTARFFSASASGGRQ